MYPSNLVGQSCRGGGSTPMMSIIANVAGGTGVSLQIPYQRHLQLLEGGRIAVGLGNATDGLGDLCSL